MHNVILAAASLESSQGWHQMELEGRSHLRFCQDKAPWEQWERPVRIVKSGSICWIYLYQWTDSISVMGLQYAEPHEMAAQAVTGPLSCLIAGNWFFISDHCSWDQHMLLCGPLSAGFPACLLHFCVPASLFLCMIFYSFSLQGCGWASKFPMWNPRSLSGSVSDLTLSYTPYSANSWSTPVHTCTSNSGIGLNTGWSFQSSSSTTDKWGIMCNPITCLLFTHLGQNRL